MLQMLLEKKTSFGNRRNHDFQMVEQKVSLESAMTVEAARDSKEPTQQLKNLIHQEHGP